MSESKLRVVVLTHSPSPYQVELFDAVADTGGLDLEVLYLYTKDPARNWAVPETKHRSRDLNDEPAACDACIEAVNGAGLFVLNFYDHPFAMKLLDARLASGGKWSFWGERTGFKHRMLGRIMRRWKLRALHRSRSPIWGIGRFAVEGYRSEFGKRRAYVDLPYFSDLTRFAASDRCAAPPPLTFLFSGSLSHRKGVDLLAESFAQVAETNSRVRLKIMGGGELESQMRSRLQACAPRVEFIGFKDWDELPAAYAQGHVLCMPSRHDGWGLVVPEALAAGLPVISTDRTGAAIEFINNGTNGWIVPAGDGGAFCNALQIASNLTPEKWGAMSRAARESVKDHTLANGAARFVEACRQAMQDS